MNDSKRKNTDMPHVVRITDGLGNQFFQYACGYALARETGKELLVDPGFGGKFRKYQLNQFNIDYKKKLLNPFIHSILKIDRTGTLIRRYRNAKLKKYELVEEKKNIFFDETVLEKQQPVLLKGYWQSYQYFQKYRDEIRRQFAWNGVFGSQAKQYLDEMGKTNSVSLHIRRTDYKRATNNVCLEMSYYMQALKILEKELGELSIFVFSDDKEFVKQEFSNYQYTLVENLSDLEEFEVMKACRHHIIANSTFSWWAAYLSDETGRVIAPVVGMWNQQFYLPEWDTIPAVFEM